MVYMVLHNQEEQEKDKEEKEEGEVNIWQWAITRLQLIRRFPVPRAATVPRAGALRSQAGPRIPRRTPCRIRRIRGGTEVRGVAGTPRTRSRRSRFTRSRTNRSLSGLRPLARSASVIPRSTT